MLTADRLKIFNELVGLCKAQLPLVKPADLHTGRRWTIADLGRAQGQPDRTGRELGRPLIEKVKQSSLI